MRASKYGVLTSRSRSPIEYFLEFFNKQKIQLGYWSCNDRFPSARTKFNFYAILLKIGRVAELVDVYVHPIRYAVVAKLADALRSGRSSRKGLGVQVSPAAHKIKIMQNYKEYFKDKKVVIMGLGLLGGALNDAIYLLKCGAKLIITDMKTEEELESSVKKLNSILLKLRGTGSFVLHLGGHQLEDFKNADFILQPGNVPVDSTYLLEAKKNNIPIHESESLFMAYAQDVKIVGITGTRGKTTATHLIYQILKKAFGSKVHLAGNVKGMSTLALLDKVKAGDIVVLELDSWCLHGIGEVKKSPHISVFTNFMPDHFNFYSKGSRSEEEVMQKYFMDKAQIFANQTESDYLILDKDIKKVINERYMGEIKSNIVLIKPSTSYVDELDNWKLKIKGEHNLKHILRAREVARIFGVDDKIIKNVVENFGGVEGRQEFIREYKGIKIYNDTTATTPDATTVALRALSSSSKKSIPRSSSGQNKQKRIVLILGGADKGLDMTGLLKEIPKYCKKVILLAGTGSTKLESLHFIKSDSLKDAISIALGFCQKGDILLFSPAFASFGMFKNEFDRGDRFNKIVKGLK